MAYRITTHKGRTTKSGKAYSAKHLDRRFNVGNARHIDPSRSHLNRYIQFNVDESGNLQHTKSHDIQAHELAVYERLFKPRLDVVNSRYISRRHKERCKTIKQYYTAAQTCPDEYLIYIGDKDNHADSTTLGRAASALITALQKKYSKNFIPLSLTLHRDELGVGEDGEGAHLHFRCVWICTDKDGIKPSITQGMKEAGIEPPKSDSGEKRYNNRQMAFSEEIRTAFADICEQQFGLEIEREARDASRSGRDLATYQREQALNDVAILTTKAEMLTTECHQLAEEVQELRIEKTRLQKITSALKRTLEKAFRSLVSMFSKKEQCVLQEICNDVEQAIAQDERVMEEGCM